MSFTSKSPWLIHYDGASCNGCDIEVLACLTPLYDVERFGVINTGNPRHADIFVVTGSVNEQAAPVVKQIYDQMVEPKVVVAVGICACSGGIFHDCYNVAGGIDKVIPVDVYVPGCAARPQAIIDGVVKGLEILEKKREALAAGVPVPKGTLRAPDDEVRRVEVGCGGPAGAAAPAPEDEAERPEAPAKPEAAAPAGAKPEASSPSAAPAPKAPTAAHAPATTTEEAAR